MKTFPFHPYSKIPKDAQWSVPWDFISPHENQAKKNHDQTLQRLSERGGLDPVEMLAVLDDKDVVWVFERKINEAEAHAEIMRRVARWEMKSQGDKEISDEAHEWAQSVLMGANEAVREWAIIGYIRGSQKRDAKWWKTFQGHVYVPNAEWVAKGETERKLREENFKLNDRLMEKDIGIKVLGEMHDKELQKAKEEGIALLIDMMNESGDQDLLRALHKIKAMAEKWKASKR